MSTVLRIACVVWLAAGCQFTPDPPPEFDKSDFSGTGDLMARCMQFASQSYCEQQIWGGGPH